MSIDKRGNILYRPFSRCDTSLVGVERIFNLSFSFKCKWGVVCVWSPPGFGNPMNRFKKYQPSDAALHAFSSSAIKNTHAARDVTDLGKSCEMDYFENKACTGNEIPSFISFIFSFIYTFCLPFIISWTNLFCTKLNNRWKRFSSQSIADIKLPISSTKLLDTILSLSRLWGSLDNTTNPPPPSSPPLPSQFLRYLQLRYFI